MPSLELDGCKHAERRVPTPAVVEHLQVLEDRISEFHASAVQELDLHAAA